MDENQQSVSYLAYESTMARFERIIKRLWIVCIILIIALIGTNGAWLYYESQFETVTSTAITQDIDAETGDAVINDGVHLYGEGKAERYSD